MVTKIIKNIIHIRWLGLGIIILCATLAYSNTFKNDFIVDDSLFIVDWPLIEDLGNFPQFFGPDNQPKGEEGVYSPLKTCFHAINYHLWGSNPAGYHLVALLIHLLGTFFIYRISFLLIPNNAIAFLSGLLFGLHPVHVEAITFLTASIDTLGVVFLFISFYFYIRCQDAETLNGPRYFYSLLFALIAIFTHELTIALPLLFLLYDLCFKSQRISFKKISLKVAPYFAFVLIYIGFKWAILGSVSRGGYLYDSFYLTMLVTIKVLAKYVFVCLAPFKLSLSSEISKGIFAIDWQGFDRQAVFSQSIFDFQVLISLLITGAMIYFAVKAWKRNPIVAFCIGWFYISLLPVLNIIPSESYFAERYLYLGTLGFCLLLSCGLYFIVNSQKSLFIRRMGICLVAMVVFFYAVRTVMRNRDWRDEIAFSTAEVAANPRHPVMRRDLGIRYLRSGQLLEALVQLEESVALRDSDQDTYFALAEVYTDLKDYPEAANAYLRAIAIDPEFAEAYYNIAGLYAYLERTVESRKYLGNAIKIYRRQGKFFEADTAEKVFNDHFGSQELLTTP